MENYTEQKLQGWLIVISNYMFWLNTCRFLVLLFLVSRWFYFNVFEQKMEQYGTIMKEKNPKTFLERPKISFFLMFGYSYRKALITDCSDYIELARRKVTEVFLLSLECFSIIVLTYRGECKRLLLIFTVLTSLTMSSVCFSHHWK